MKKYILVSKIFIFLLVSGVVFSEKISYSLALPLTSVSRSAVMDVIRWTEEHYHISDDSVRDAMEQMNVTNRKGSAPEVEIFFSPGDPKPGEKITATALPIYFTTPKEQSYFTWYLKQEGCDLCENNSTANRCSQAELDKCDENNDHRVTVEDWKITAMRIIAQNGFDRNTDDRENTDDDGYRAHMGGDTNRQPSSGYHCFLHDFSNGQNYEMVDHCEHLFPNALVFVNNQTHHHTTGDGVFNKEEELFWGTDPEDPDTANNGNKDEANVAGLGIDKFTWNYMPGDQVGVAVEGLSLNPTKENDASKMIMWALPKNKCTPEGRSSYTTRIKGYNVTIPTTTTDINDCLPSNLVDPREGDQAHNLDINLKYFPEIPNNDPDGEKLGDKVVVESHIANLKTDARQVHYKWKIKALSTSTFSLDNNDWTDITDELENIEAVKLSKREGVGKDSLSFYLNVDRETGLYDSIFRNRNSSFDSGYLRVYVEANEFFENYNNAVNHANTGKTDVIIKVISGNNKIEFFKPEIIGNASEVRLRESDETICDDEDNRYICYVVNNELLGARITHSDSLHNFHWTINGSPINCDENVSIQCTSGEESDVIFFPIVGNLGKRYEINVVANDIEADDLENNPTGTENQLHLSRTLMIIDPYIKLIPSDVDHKKLLGHYINVNSGEEVEDRSENVFQYSPGDSVEIRAELHPGWIGSKISDEVDGNGHRDWGFWLDGQDVSLLSEDNPYEAVESRNDNGFNLIFQANKKINESFNVTFKALLLHSSDVRRALSSIWGITQYDTQEILLEDDAQVELVSNRNSGDSNTSSLAPSHKVFASVISAVPENLMFTLRILLMGGLILFVSGVIFSFVNAGDVLAVERNQK